MGFFEFFKKLGKKDKSVKAAVPKSAQDIVPFIEAYENGLLLTEPDTYTLVFAFENIDYRLLRDKEQRRVYEQYMTLLNSIPANIHYQEYVCNNTVDRHTLAENMLPRKNTTANSEIVKDYSEVINGYIDSSLSASAHKILLIALSYHLNGKIQTPDVLFKYYTKIVDLFTNIGSAIHQLSCEAIFEMLYNMYHPFASEDGEKFFLPHNLTMQGGSIKDCIAPSIFNFKKRGIEIGSSFMRIMFVRSFDRYIDDEFIYDLLDHSEKVSVSKHLDRIDKAQAMEMVRQNIFDLEGDIQRRKEKNHKSGTDYIPYRLREKEQELNELQERLGGENIDLFRLSIFISVVAENEDDLDELTRFVQNKAAEHQVRVAILNGQQKEGLLAMTPVANCPFSEKTHNNIGVHLLSDAAGVLVPFSAVDHFDAYGVFYGKNIETGAVIVIDRAKALNANGIVLGFTGSGKSMFSKSEFIDAILKYPKDEFIIIDPDNEYGGLLAYFDGDIFRLSPSSKTKLNIFDIDMKFQDEGVSAIALKSETIMTIYETAKGTKIESTERSVIDRCVQEVYKPYIASNENPEMLPTFLDFYNLLLDLSETDPVATGIAATLELYVTGSFNIFSGHTNIKTDKKFLLFDISSMGEQIRDVGLQVILEYIWMRVVRNRKNGIRTWVWTDEFSVMFSNKGKSTEQSGEFFAKVYRRIRKYGGVPTAITQNMHEVLQSPQARSMLSNSDFKVLLQQDPDNLEEIGKLFKLSEHHLQYLKTGKPGTGLILSGNKIIPFEKPIPKDSLLYKICTTRFGE